MIDDDYIKIYASIVTNSLTEIKRLHHENNPKYK